jgi:NADPH:quinone reductase-like Zn-dependent oxidoreductase
MKAVLLTEYGSPDGLQLQEVAKPTPKDRQVLIRIHAATVSAGDCEIRTLKFPFWLALPIRLYLGFNKPRRIILGQELAGEVEALGKDVTRFKVGDRVFATTGLNLGAYAEYTTLSQGSAVAIIPAALTYEEAAAVPVGGLEALHFLRHAHIQSGQKVLIYGAGGSIGTMAVQLARYFGAGDVTAVDSAEKLDMLRSIGADHVIDYMQEDFTRSGDAYDIILDVVGKSPFFRSLSALNPNGHYLLANPGLSQTVRAPWASRMTGKHIFLRAADPKTEDLRFLGELLEAGKIKVVIDKHYLLEQAAEAHRYVEAGHKKGNVILTV